MVVSSLGDGKGYRTLGRLGRDVTGTRFARNGVRAVCVCVCVCAGKLKLQSRGCFKASCFALRCCRLPCRCR